MYRQLFLKTRFPYYDGSQERDCFVLHQIVQVFVDYKHP